MIEKTRPRRVLIITSSGGGAHLSAAEALRQRLRADASVESVHTIDLLRQWAGLAGQFGIGVWNHAMRRGDSRSLDRAIGLQGLGDVLLRRRIRRRLRTALRDWSINEILDCQVMSTHEQLEVARDFDVPVTKVLTEPAHAALGQYRKPIVRLPAALRRRLTVWGSEPLREDDETVGQFWGRRWELDFAQVETDSGFPVRAPFANGHHAADRPLVLDRGDGQAPVRLPAGAQPVTVVMGSQGTREFTRSAVLGSLECRDDPSFVVVAYVPDPPLRQELRQRAAALASRSTLVALPFIESSTLAELYRRSCATITRSGGMTSMELLSVGRAPALVFSRNHRRESHAGMVEHEYGNFRYMKRFHEPGAWVVDESDLKQRLLAVTNGGSAVLQATL
ncbi:MAG: hypothetical protein GY716_09870 [bacterium]|nr:hypothetical protein [bacterium]